MHLAYRLGCSSRGVPINPFGAQLVGLHTTELSTAELLRGKLSRVVLSRVELSRVGLQAALRGEMFHAELPIAELSSLSCCKRLSAVSV